MTDYKQLCAELLAALESWSPNGGAPLEEGVEAIAEARLIERARAALSQPEPAGLSDEELLQIAAKTIEPYEDCGIGIDEYEAETECAVEAYGSELIAFARAAIAADRAQRQPVPPQPGEVQELVRLIRQIALAWEPDATLLGNMTAGQLARAAELLSQRYPQPVPVSERLWEREGWCDKQGRCWWGRSADECCNPDWHYATRAEVEEFCSEAMPQVSLPAHALPLPGEVKG